MIVDLHAHYPMHLQPQERPDLLTVLTSRRSRGRLLDRLRTGTLGGISRFGNYESPSSGPRVTVPTLRTGDVGVALSVLLSAFDEFDLTKRYGAVPDDSYFRRVLRQIELVERDIATNFAGEAVVAHTPAELEQALSDGRLALVHCLEGGFHLGSTAATVEHNISELARRGIAYITLAHLFWRGIATNSPAIPFLTDSLYDRLFPQPELGLTELGRAAVRAMVREGVLIDLSHMSERALSDTFTLLDELDPRQSIAVLATHVGYRFGGRRYNLTDTAVKQIADRNGVIGLILCDQYIRNGLRPRRTRSFEQSIDLLCRHIDQIAELTGSHDNIAIGTDLDGYIKPTLAGLEDSSKMANLERALTARYGKQIAAKITSDNSLLLLRHHWQHGVKPILRG